MINLIGAVPVEITVMLPLIIDWTTAITEYVLEFVRFIMPLFIYVATFQIIVKKS